MPGLEILFLMCLVVLFAYLVKGISGFAEGMIMMSLCLLFLDIKFVLPAMLAVMLAGDIYNSFRLKKDVEWKTIRLAILPAIAGVILGTILLSVLGSALIKIAFGIFVSLFALNLLLSSKKETPGKINRLWGAAAGFSGGLIEALLGTGGPPVVIYLNHTGLKKAAFRATCAAFFLVFNLARLPAYLFAGILTIDTVLVGIALVPAMVLGTALGMKAHNFFDEKVFAKCVAVLLLLIGLKMVF
ncbi:MAG: sulfite exporter TauE/SafE family protein [Candidatus Diapherotrites archaeon]|nr:sulfite exporter TauE/SafE family protein [Candidatus Diapherotrites archaeon]